TGRHGTGRHGTGRHDTRLHSTTRLTSSGWGARRTAAGAGYGTSGRSQRSPTRRLATPHHAGRGLRAAGERHAPRRVSLVANTDLDVQLFADRRHQERGQEAPEFVRGAALSSLLQSTPNIPASLSLLK